MDLAKNHLSMSSFWFFPNYPFCWFLKPRVTEFIDPGKARDVGKTLVASYRRLLYSKHHDEDFRPRISEWGLFPVHVCEC